MLEGRVVYEPETAPDLIGRSYQLRTGDEIELTSGIFHKILNVGDSPAYYMYTFYNSSAVNYSLSKPVPKLPIVMELQRRFNNMTKFANDIITSLIQLLFNVSKCFVQQCEN